MQQYNEGKDYLIEEVRKWIESMAQNDNNFASHGDLF
jgi:hypothetical protein